VIKFGLCNRVGDYRSYSKEKQDLFAYYLMGKAGTFLDLGCWHPDNANNTMLLEEMGWNGLMFDSNMSAIHKCIEKRSSKAFCLDVSSEVFELVLEKYWPNQHFDYISLDVDKASLPALENLLRNDYTFKCMTFEHDFYMLGDELRKPSRELLKSCGYNLLFADVKLRDGSIWEDWWVDSKQFSKDIMSISASGLCFDECIKKIEELSSHLSDD